ncbi:sugar ABC transporter substrate-binding protein [Microbacterium sp. LWS13-1.2]|uniref:Sugar ABC transporter substrate-binding protein n=1 Tax=Microbacterium sp. LWS13-1.2 TaxID=3135264 RepID=A0AAU6S8N4_9MICO
MRNSKLTTAVIGIAASSVLLAGCSGASDSDATAASDAWTIGYAAPVQSQQGQQAITNGMIGAAADLGWKTDILDANLSADKQSSDMQTMLQKGDNVLALWTLDMGAMQGTFAQAKAANVPLIGVNDRSPEFTTSVFWEVYLCEADDAPNKLTAQMIAKAHPGGKILVMGGPPVASLQANVACFVEAAEAAGLEVVNETDNMTDDPAAASSLAADMLSKYPGVDAFWSYNDASALGISAAIIQSGGTISDGTSPGIILVGTNGDDDAIQAIKQGRLTGTWDPNTTATGAAVVKAAKDIQDGNPDKELVVKSTFWTKANLDSYVAPDDRSYSLDDLPLVTQ